MKFPIWPGPGGLQALKEGGCLLSKRHRAPGKSILTGRQQLHQPLQWTAFSPDLRSPLQTRPCPQAAKGSAPPVRPSWVRSHPAEAAGQDCAPAPGASTSEPRNAPANARPPEHWRWREPPPQWLLREKKKKTTRREGRVRPHRAGRRVPEATGGARIAGRAHRGPHSACRLTRPAPSGPRCHCPGRPSTGGQSFHPSVTLTGRPGDDENRSLGRPAELRSSNFRLPGAVASNNSPAEGTTAPARRV